MPMHLESIRYKNDPNDFYHYWFVTKNLQFPGLNFALEINNRFLRCSALSSQHSTRAKKQITLNSDLL